MAAPWIPSAGINARFNRTLLRKKPAMNTVWVPVVGVVIYYALGRSTIPGWQRVTLLVGGPVAYGILLVIGNLVGGVA